MQYEISITVYMGRIANQRIVPKLYTKSQNYQTVDVQIQGHISIFIPNTKFLCLTLWLGELYADHNTNADDAGWTKRDCTRLFG